jgi:PII-like signaling protein
MKGYEITFFTQQDRLHGLKQISEWLLLTARNLGLRGATIVTGSEGYGHNRHIHSARFFELADNPQEIVIIVTEEESNILFDYLEKEGVQLFYVKKPVEFGTLGKPDQNR